MHYIAYGDFKYLPRRKSFDKVLHDKTFSAAKHPKYNGYQMVYNFFDEKSASGGGIKDKIMPSEAFAEKLHKPIITKLEKRKVHSSFIDNIWGTDPTNMQLISKFKKESCFILCVIDVFTKYQRGVPLKNKKKVLQLLILFKKFF